MQDTAQPLDVAADPNAQLENAADAFKAFLDPTPAQPRNDRGQFAADQEDAADDEELTGEVDAEDGIDDAGEGDDQDVDEAADEAQPDAVDMPSSWSKDDAELWGSLSAEAQAKIAEREAQRDQGLNAKLQEAANARKLVEQRAAEANANRDAYAQAIDQVVGLLQLPKPDPTQYGMGTGQYDRDAYEIAVYQWENAQGQLQALHQQRQQITAQQEQEANQARQAAMAEVEQVAWPKFLETVPDLADPEKGRGIISDIVKFAVTEGLPEDVFRNGQVNSNEMRLLWEAMQYRQIKAAGQRVKAGNPPPKPATPPVRPGGVTPRATVKAARMDKAQARLAKEGSVEAGAAVFKQFFR